MTRRWGNTGAVVLAAMISGPAGGIVTQYCPLPQPFQTERDLLRHPSQPVAVNADLRADLRYSIYHDAGEELVFVPGRPELVYLQIVKDTIRDRFAIMHGQRVVATSENNALHRIVARAGNLLKWLSQSIRGAYYDQPGERMPSFRSERRIRELAHLAAASRTQTFDKEAYNAVLTACTQNTTPAIPRVTEKASIYRVKASQLVAETWLTVQVTDADPEHPPRGRVLGCMQVKRSMVFSYDLERFTPEVHRFQEIPCPD